MSCIYCGSSEGTTVSHVIPDSLGGTIELADSVCSVCNGKFNQAVEQGFTNLSWWPRAAWKIEGSRVGSRPARMRAEARFRGKKQALKLLDQKDLEQRVFVFELDEQDERQVLFVSQNEDALREHTQRFEHKHGIELRQYLEECEIDDDLEFIVTWDFRFLFEHISLRLAAKIGFEYWCIRRPGIREDREENRNVIQYILNGAGNVEGEIVSVATDPAFYRCFGNIPIGQHWIYTHCDVRRNRLVAYVSLFGLLVYRVVVRERYPCLALDSELLINNPQMRELYSPQILRNLRRVPTAVLAEPKSSIDPTVLEDELGDFVRKRLTEATVEE